MFLSHKAGLSRSLLKQPARLLLLSAALLLGLSSFPAFAAAYNADLKINALGVDDTTPDEGQFVEIAVQAKHNASDGNVDVPGIYVDIPLPAGLTFDSLLTIDQGQL